MQTVDLKAGRLTARLNRVTGALEHVCLGNHPLWRSLFIQVRDSQWRSVPGKLHDCSITTELDSFEARFQCRHERDGINYQLNATILGFPNSEILYQFDGEALIEFQSNRIGFCLLHAADACEGRPIRQFRVDTTVVEGEFPQCIEPQIVDRYSICELQALEHAFTDQCWARVEFEGDVFETEDQRNWCDASFKTYCTPLSKPIPVDLRTGDQHHQTVRLCVNGFSSDPINLSNLAKKHETDLRIFADDQQDSERYTVPQLGVSLPQDFYWKSTQAEIQEVCDALSLSTLRLDWYVVHSVELTPQLCEQLRTAVSFSEHSGVKLDLAIQLPASGHPFPAALESELRRSAKTLQRVSVYRQGQPVTTLADIVAIRKVLLGLDVPIGGGSDANFCELNREHSLGRLPVEQLDYVSWSVSPQVHATDDESLMETPFVFSRMIESARKLFPKLPLVIGPITLKPRFNAVATRPSQLEWPPYFDSDSRQSHDIAAAWTVAATHRLYDKSVDAVNFFETSGPRGVSSSVAGKSISDSLYPTGKAIQEIASLNANHITLLRSSSQKVSAAIFHSDRETTLSVVNMTSEPAIVEFRGTPIPLASYECRLQPT